MGAKAMGFCRGQQCGGLWVPEEMEFAGTAQAVRVHLPRPRPQRCLGMGVPWAGLAPGSSACPPRLSVKWGRGQTGCSVAVLTPYIGAWVF